MAAFKSLLLLLFLTTYATSTELKYRICSKISSKHDCTQITRSLEIECKKNLHGIDCINNIQQELSNFGRVTAEEALIAANFVQKVVVIGEIRSDAVYDDSVYQTVVLVKADYPGGFTNLRGKKLCHPGFRYDESVSELLLKEFEQTVLKANNVNVCSNDVSSGTVAEKELKALFEFFGPSCRPGPWSTITNYNDEFYNRYDRLCELCDHQEKCSVPNDVAPFTYSLDCLLKENGGDVALTSLNTVKQYFKSENISQQSYKYLCRDGSLNSLDRPCVWSKQPWDLIVANSVDAGSIRSLIEKKWLPNSIISLSNGTVGIGTSPTDSVIEDSLKGILSIEKGSNKIHLVNEISLQNYIKDFRPIPNIKEKVMCGQQIRWCTISAAEQEKCLWLAQASLGHAIQPVIDCVPSVNKLTCLDDIRRDRVDVVTSDAHYGYIARKKGLAPVAYAETEPNSLLQTLLIIKTTDTDKIQKFGDLRDKKACFPEYGGLEWLSFINAGQRHGIFSTSVCEYGRLFSSFVGDSCVPGAHDSDHEISLAADKEKLCRLCLPIITGTAVTCNTDSTNLYHGNAGALKCLNEVGEFAVITKSDEFKVDSTKYRVLCQNGTLAAYSGFDVEPNCALSITVDSEVVTRRSQPNKNKDIELVLFTFERRFGTDRSKSFEVFNKFNNTLDLLFKDSTPGLVETYSDNLYVKNYANLYAHMDKCIYDKPDIHNTPKDNPGAADSLHTSMVAIITSVVLLLFFKVFY